jgi:general secretion pathway protein A
MYLKHFAFKERPFTISPDPRFLFMSNRYREALAHLTYGVQEGGGFVLLTGEVGTGKTTVCRCLLQQLPDHTRLAFVLNPKLNSVELLATICDELKIEYPENCSSLKLLTDKISAYLLQSYKDGFNVVVMIDEAQNLAIDVLEQIRLLTNLETNQKKLLQIILVGQPELQEKLARRELRQLAQRITARYHLRPLNLKETIAYVLHRVRIAGAINAPFTRRSVEYLHQKTAGIPRLVNTICDRALFAAAARNQSKVNKAVMIQAVKEVMGENLNSDEILLARNSHSVFKQAWIKTTLITLAALSLAACAYWLGQNQGPLGGGSKSVYQVSESSVQERSVSENDASKKQTVQAPTSIQTEDSEAEFVTATNTSLTGQLQRTSELSNVENLAQQLIGEERWDPNGNWSMQNLLKLWQIDYAVLRDGDACQFAATYGLKCANYRGNWQRLRSFNRPALLKFSAGLQGEFWATIQSVRGFDAEILVGDKISRVSLDKLSNLWTGEFLILWQSPQGYVGDIKLGDSGPAVSWLKQKLSQINQADFSTSDVFDINLQLELKKFQRLRSINADGIAGMQTILKINTEALKGIPLLLGYP